MTVNYNSGAYIDYQSIIFRFLFMSTIQDALWNASTNIFSAMYQFLPRLFGAVAIFLLGLIISNWIKKIVVHILQSLNLTNLAKKTKIHGFLEKAEIKRKIEDVIGSLFKWLVILIFIVTSINVLGLTTIAGVLNNILAYIPSIISAIFVLGIGVLLAGFVEKVVKGAVAQFDARMGRLLGKVASYIMVIFAAMAALNELQIAEDLINILFIGFVAMLSIGFGLALGLGAKDVVSTVLLDWYKRFTDDVKGTIEEKEEK